MICESSAKRSSAFYRLNALPAEGQIIIIEFPWHYSTVKWRSNCIILRDVIRWLTLLAKSKSKNRINQLFILHRSLRIIYHCSSSSSTKKYSQNEPTIGYGNKLKEKKRNRNLSIFPNTPSSGNELHRDCTFKESCLSWCFYEFVSHVQINSYLNSYGEKSNAGEAQVVCRMHMMEEKSFHMISGDQQYLHYKLLPLLDGTISCTLHF